MRKNLTSIGLHCILGMVALGTLSGCFSTISNMTPGKMEWIQADSTSPRAGKAYLMRGLIGLFSGGIDELTVKIDQAGVNAHVFQEDQRQIINETLVERYRNRPDHEPIILIGHSLGADNAINAARALDAAGVEVDILVSIDATRAPVVPKNVKIVYNYYQPSILDGTGIFRGMALTTDPGFKGKIYNMNVRAEYKHLLEWDTNHVNIDKNTKIHADIIEKLMPVCIPRQQWAASRMPILAGSTTRPISQVSPPRGATEARKINEVSTPSYASPAGAR